MPQSNTVFHTIASRIPWGVFTRAVAVHRSDRNIRRLPTRAQFMALLFGQIQGIDTLRGLIAAINSHAARHYHLGETELGVRLLNRTSRQFAMTDAGEEFHRQQ